MSEKIVLIDGHSILNRAFYGVPDLTNASGLHTNAIYGFLNILFKILDEEKPQYLAVAFDVKAPTFRHEIYKEYKGTRKPMPEELRQQVPVMKDVLKAMNVLIMEQPGLEADDILGTMAKNAQSEGMEVALISGDRDLLQISDEHIKIRIPKTKGGKTEVEDYYPQDVIEKYGVNPIQFIDLKALMGDTADNIPGVPKVGEKTATELMKTFGSLDQIYEHLSEVNKGAIQKSLSENKELAYLSKTLATIEIHASLPFTVSMAKMKNLLTEEAYLFYKKLELKSLLKKFENCTSNGKEKTSFRRICTAKEVKDILNKARKSSEVSFSVIWDEKAVNPQNVQLSLFEDEKPQYGMLGAAVTLSQEETFWMEISDTLSEAELRHALVNFYRNSSTLISMFHCKDKMNYFCEEEYKNKKASETTDRFFDVLLAAFLLNPLKNDYEIADIANEYLGLTIPTYPQLFNKQSFFEAQKSKPQEFMEYVCYESYVCFMAYGILAERLKETQMDSLLHEIEMPLSLVLSEMEQEGILVNPFDLKEYGNELSEKISLLEKRIIEQAGEEFNINSPKQLGEILFEKLGMDGGKKTKTGYSTAADVLEKIAPQNPIVADILEYRGLTKLKSTYADGLANEIDKDGRIHTSFHQTITATGRISSTEPNLQNIPIRMELGRLIRKVFVPKAGFCFMDADYSQIELRILAHMSQDEQLIQAYQIAEDIHKITASKVFHVPLDEVTSLQRRNAKAVNFGIVYGISSFGLSQGLSISKKEAATYIEEYFKTYPQIKEFLDKMVADAKDKGYSETMFHRRRPVPELSSSNFMQRSFGERVAMNAPIQGTAADIMKIAMIHVRDELTRQKLKSKILLQVHDELLLEVAKEEETLVKEILTNEMEHAANLAVHLDVDLHTGENWYEAK